MTIRVGDTEYENHSEYLLDCQVDLLREIAINTRVRFVTLPNGIAVNPQYIIDVIRKENDIKINSIEGRCTILSGEINDKVYNDLINSLEGK